MTSRRARFKPVLNQAPRRGRSAATDVQPVDAVKESVVSQDQSDKNSCTPSPNNCNSVIKPDLSSTPVIKNSPKDDSSTIYSKPTSNVPEVLSQPSTASSAPVQKDVVEEQRVPESPKQGSTTAASSSKPDAASTSAVLGVSQLPSRIPPRRPSSPGLSSSESSVTKNEAAAARSSKDERTETAPNSRQRRQPSTMNQRALAARRNIMKIAKDGPPQRSSLTMFDLIFYNPVTNPMSKKSPPPAKIRDRQESVSSVSTVQEQRLEEEKVDDVDDNQIKELEDKENKENKEEKKEEEEEAAVPVPRVKVGPDGRIVIDEQSLVIETTESKKNREVMDKSEVIFDTGLSNGFYKRSARSKDWSNRETLKFYRALHVYGTDFSLMQVLFKDRTRKELKLKFKKEEKMRMHLIDKALCSPLDFDPTELEEEAQKEEEEEAARLAKEKEEKNKPKPIKPKPVKNRKPCSLAQKEMCQDSLSELCSSENVPPPKKKKIVRKPKSEPAAQPKADGAPRPDSAPTGLDFFDDVVLPTDVVRSTSANEKAPKKVPALKKRKASPRDSNKPPKKSKMTVEAHLSPESDHTYAASPFRTPQIPGTPAAKTPTRTPAKNPLMTPARSNMKNEQSPGLVTIDLSNHVLLTPSPTRTVTMFPNECASSQARTPKTPVSINISHGSPYDYGPAPNRAVPVPLPTPLASSGVNFPQTPSPVEPGSFYVLQTQCPDDPQRHVLGVYMVTNNQSKVVSTPPSANELLVEEALKASSPKSETVRDPVEGTVLTKL